MAKLRSVRKPNDRHRSSRKRGDVLDQALNDVRGGATPNIDGQEYLGTLMVEDPYECDAQMRSVKRVKVISTRDDPVGWMYQHGQLARDGERDGRDAETRLMAARRFEQLYERAEIGGARAIDFTRDVVDGGQIVTPDAMLRSEALAELNAMWRLLGINGSLLVRRVIGEKRTLVEVAAMLLGIEVPKDRVERSMLIRGLLENFLCALDKLADHFGVRPLRGARGPRRTSDRWDSLAPFAAIHPELARAVRRAQKER
jgi:hypothetical protein